MEFCVVNGNITPYKQASLHISDLGLLRGYGVFDYFRVVAFQPLFFDDYLARFERSADVLNLHLPVSRRELKQQILDLIKRNKQKDASIRLVLTGGYSPDGFTPATPNLLILEHPLKLPETVHYKKGHRLISHTYTRSLAEAKTTDYSVAIQLAPKQKSAKAIDILYHNEDTITETARSNIFVVLKDNHIVTPAKNILKGVTRKQIIKLAKQSFELEEKSVSLKEVFSAKEVFITSSIKGVMPIVKIDDQTIGTGKPGEVAKTLAQLFSKHVEAYLTGQLETSLP